MSDNNTQRTLGRRQPCCVSMWWAVRAAYIKRGYMWQQDGKPVWIPWTFHLADVGWMETSPIHFCPFCGVNLDKLEGD